MSRLDDYDDSSIDGLIRQAYRHQRQADEATEDWRHEFVDLHELVAGRQWNAYDRSRRERDLRPTVEFNLVQKFLDAVQGLQINNRQEIRYIPREMGDVGVNELLTGAVDWARDNCDALTEESEAFLECVTGGLGAVETFIDFGTNPEGDFGVARRDPLEMFWDTQARQRNLLDARWLARVRRMDRAELEERWPEKVDEVLSKSFHTDLTGETEYSPILHDATEAWRYEGSSTAAGLNQFAPAAVLEYQWYKVEKMYKVTTPYATKMVTPKQWSRMEDMLKANKVLYRSQNVRTKRYHRFFSCGGVMLTKKDEMESPYQGGMTYQFITGRRDRNMNTWHGIGRHFRDPQRWVNAFFSEVIYIVQNSAKGGLLAEEDAFADPQKAEAEWARSDSIVFTEPGAVQQGKIIPKPQNPYPQSLDKLMEFAVGALPGTTGLNLEFLGMADRMQPGVVESYRKQSAISVLAWAFDSLRRYYIEHGRCAAYYVREYLSDGRLIRIVGKEGAQYIPLLREDMALEYDVIVDEAPNSPNQRERTWATFEKIAPHMVNMGIQPPIEILDYLPIPSSLTAAWKKTLTTAKPDPLKEAEINEKNAKAEQLRGQAGQEAIKLEQEKAKLEVEQKKLEIERQKMETEKQKLAADLRKSQIEVVKVGAEAEVRSADAFNKRAQGVKALSEAKAQDTETDAVKAGIIDHGKTGGSSEGSRNRQAGSG